MANSEMYYSTICRKIKTICLYINTIHTQHILIHTKYKFGKRYSGTPSEAAPFASENVLSRGVVFPQG